MSEEFPTKTHIRHCLLYEFNLGRNATEAANNLRGAYGDKGPSVRECQRWFERFRNGDFSVEDKPRSGHPQKVDNEVLRTLIESNPKQSLEEMSVELKCDRSTIWRHLKQIGKVFRAGVWIPHELTDSQRSNRIMICSSLLFRHNECPFLERIVTSDEKWVCYENPERGFQWIDPGQTPLPTAKPGLHPKKAMLCIWWDYQGVIWFDVLEMGQTVTADLYCRQLDRLSAELKIKRPSLVNREKVILLHDNAKPHTAKVTLKKIKELKYEVLPHPPYSCDIAPSDYHLFRSLQHHLKGKKYADNEGIKNDLDQFFAKKEPSFFSKGIEDLVTKWAQVVENDGHYIIN